MTKSNSSPYKIWTQLKSRCDNPNHSKHKINLKFINYREYENYSDGEIIKLKDYDKITDQIIKDIEDNIDKSPQSIMNILRIPFPKILVNLLAPQGWDTVVPEKMKQHFRF